ncbi:MAG: DUF805 domain-containing protein [Pseudomonadota bacterium]
MNNLGHYFSFAGRTTRRGYFAIGFVTWIIWGVALSSIGMSVVDLATGNLSTAQLAMASGFQVLLLLATLIVTGLLNISACTRRLHDVGWSAKNLFWLAVPIIGPLALMFVQFFISGTRGPNAYGPDPRDRAVKTGSGSWSDVDLPARSMSLDAALEQRLQQFKSENMAPAVAVTPQMSYRTPAAAGRTPHSIKRPTFGKR